MEARNCDHESVDMSFQVPNEYKDFVSTSEQILEQIQAIDISDKVACRIFTAYDDGCDSSSVFRLFSELAAFMDSESANYLWFREKPQFSVVVTNDLIDEKSNGAESKSKDVTTYDMPYIEGSFRYGDCVDDEWYFVYLIQKFGKIHKNLSISVCDSDGQFLLIEAADHIPDWIGPDNCHNRVWLKDGDVHIIPYDEPGRTSDGGIKLRSALEAMSTSGQSGNNCTAITLANLAVQKCVISRTFDVFPGLIDASTHKTVCFLPQQTAQLFNTAGNEQLLADAINAFCAPEAMGGSREREKVLNAMEHFLPKSEPNVQVVEVVGENHDTHDNGNDDTDNEACVAVQLTRSLYSKLIFKPYAVPRILHPFQKRAVSAISASDELSRQHKDKDKDEESSSKVNGEKQRHASRGADVSCRLLCGLELLHSVSSKIKDDDKDTASYNIKSYLDKLSLYDETASKNALQLYKSNENSIIVQNYGITTTSEPSKVKYTTAPFHISFKINQKSNTKTKDFCGRVSSVTGSAKSDDESWLHMTPDELELEMKARISNRGLQKGNNDGSPGASASTSKPDSDKTSKFDTDQMDKIAQGVESFLGKESGVDGAENTLHKEFFGDDDSESATDSDESNDSDGSDVYSEDEYDERENIDCGLEIDFEVLLSLVEGKDAPVSAAAATESHSKSTHDISSQDKCGANSKTTKATKTTDSSHTNHGSKSVGIGFIDDGITYPILPPKHALDSDDEIDEVDNGVEGDNGNSGQNQDWDSDDFDEEEYAQLMDLELQTSSLAKSFERKAKTDSDSGELGEVDMYKNLLANLLESHASQEGLPGPASQLLSQLGLNLPPPPSLSEKEEKKNN